MSGYVTSTRQFGPRPKADPAQNPAKLALIGRKIGERLRSLDRIEELGGDEADLFVVPHFLSEEGCARLVEICERKIGPSTLFKGTEVDGFRTSSTHHFEQDDPATIALQRGICKLLGMPIAHAEVTQAQRYEPGQQYKHHFDYFIASQDYWQQERRRGGQRTWTAMLVIKGPDEGGETDFPKLGVKVKCETGALVVWNNMDRDGRPNPRTLHAGLPVVAGRKYVVTQWFRQEHWSLHLR